MTYREIIQAEFEKRRTKDLFYSLRKYAKDLGLNPMHLSNLLKGKRGLSDTSASKVALRLGLEGSLASAFILLAATESGRSKARRRSAKLILQKRLRAQALSKVNSKWTS